MPYTELLSCQRHYLSCTPSHDMFAAQGCPRGIALATASHRRKSQPNEFISSGSVACNSAGAHRDNVLAKTFQVVQCRHARLEEPNWTLSLFHGPWACASCPTRRAQIV